MAATIPLNLQYQDTDGSPLDGGYLYFGTAGQNPITNPITVYWDAALTQPASQPVRTVNGYPSRSGNIANIYSSVNYSLVVKNSNLETVYSELTSANSIFGSLLAAAAAAAALAASAGSSLIGFIQAGTGAVMQTVQAALRERYTLAQFGAVCDWNGTTGTDAAAEVQDAIDAVYTAGGGTIKAKAGFALGSTVTIKPGVVLDLQWNQVGALADADLFHVIPGGQLKNARVSCVAQTTYSSIACKLTPAANTQGDRFIPWLDGVFVQFYSSGVDKGTAFYWDGATYYLQLLQAHRTSARYGGYGHRMVGASGSQYVNGNSIVGYTNFRSTYSIHGDAYSEGNVFEGVVIQGAPDGAISFAGGRNKVSGVPWDDVAITSSGAGNDFDDLCGTTQYGITLTDTGNDTRAKSRGSSYYDYTSINTRDDARHEFRGPGKIEFRDFLLGGKDPRWTETLTGTGAVTYSSAEFGAAVGFKAWMPYAEFTCPQGSNNVLWNFNGMGIVRADQNPKVHFTNYTATGDARIFWEIGLYTDANNYIVLRSDYEAYSDDDIRLITCAGGTATTEVLATSGTGRINFASLLITDSLVTARVKQYNNAGAGATGRVSDGAYWNGDEVTATSATNIPTGNLEPRIFVDHGAAANANSAVMRLMDYQLIAGRKSTS